MKRAKLCYNPKSGNGSWIKNLDLVIEKYQKANINLCFLRLDEAIIKEGLFTCQDQDLDHILVAGGDGTVDLVVNEMKKANLDLPLAILPAGTANDFANYLGLAKDLPELLDDILAGQMTAVDLGQLNDSYFVNVFAAGHFTDISQKTPSELKNSIGVLAYFLKSLELLREVKTVWAKFDSPDYRYEGEFFVVMVLNGKTTGGMTLAPKADACDGLLDVVLMKGRTLGEMIPPIMNLLRGDLKGAMDSGLIYFQTKELSIEVADEIPSDMDGEKGPQFPVTIRCLEGALKILGANL